MFPGSGGDAGGTKARGKHVRPAPRCLCGPCGRPDTSGGVKKKLPTKRDI